MLFHRAAILLMNTSNHRYFPQLQTLVKEQYPVWSCLGSGFISRFLLNKIFLLYILGIFENLQQSHNIRIWFRWSTQSMHRQELYWERLWLLWCGCRWFQRLWVQMLGAQNLQYSCSTMRVSKWIHTSPNPTRWQIHLYTTSHRYTPYSELVDPSKHSEAARGLAKRELWLAESLSELELGVFSQKFP